MAIKINICLNTHSHTHTYIIFVRTRRMLHYSNTIDRVRSCCFMFSGLHNLLSSHKRDSGPLIFRFYSHGRVNPTPLLRKGPTSEKWYRSGHLSLETLEKEKTFPLVKLEQSVGKNSEVNWNQCRNFRDRGYVSVLSNSEVIHSTPSCPKVGMVCITLVQCV